MLTVLLPVLFLLPHTAQGITKEGVGAVGEACSMGGGVRGRCQEVGACLKEGGVVNRANQVQLCNPHPSDIIVCCRKPNLVAENLCAAWALRWRSPAGHCIDKTNLIVGGVNADPGEFPHVALLGVRVGGNMEIVWKCGGTLLTPHFVLTAAHCLQFRGNSVEYWVKLGEYNLNNDRSGELIPVVRGLVPSSILHADELAADTTSHSPLEQTILVEDHINHPEYDRLIKYYDIALLKLSTKANLTERVLPACLPTDPSQDLVGHELTVIGWGHKQSGHRELATILQKVNVPVVDQLECQFKYPDYRGRDTPKGILKDQLCAGKTGRDSCQSDSGGPLIDQKERGGSRCEHTVEGIVSFGRGCGELGVYTRVSSYLDWITGYIAPGDY